MFSGGMPSGMSEGLGRSVTHRGPKQKIKGRPERLTH